MRQRSLANRVGKVVEVRSEGQPLLRQSSDQLRPGEEAYLHQ